MMKCSGGQLQEKIGMRSRGPELDIKKLGIVSRDYNHRFPDGSYDFSSTLRKVLELLDKEKCDAVLFSLYSINSGKPFELETALNGLKRIKAVFLEEFEDGSWSPIRNVVHHCLNGKWNEYQAFGSLTGLSHKSILSFVKEEMPKRILGNCCLLLCGESNGVKYSRTDKKVNDTFGLRAAIPHGVNIVLRATGGGISGLGAISPPPAATSRRMSYFSIFRSTNLPASDGSYSVPIGTRATHVGRATTNKPFEGGRIVLILCSSAAASYFIRPQLPARLPLLSMHLLVAERPYIGGHSLEIGMRQLSAAHGRHRAPIVLWVRHAASDRARDRGETAITP
jgi:hypothetical protein